MQAPILNSFFLFSAVVVVACTEQHRPSPEAGAGAAPIPPVAMDQLAKFRQLAGSWVDSTTTDRFTCYENWTTSGDTCLLGSGYVLAKGDTVFIEELKLATVDGQVTYSARIGSQNEGRWVPFAALPSGPDSLIFENPGHDFPQCITYVKDSAGGWQVTVTGNEQGTERTERFHYCRRGATPTV